VRGKMDKCTFCAGGPRPTGSQAEFEKYGRNRLAEGKLPACAEMCDQGAARRRWRRGGRHLPQPRAARQGCEVWGWGTAYGPSRQASLQAQPEPSHDTH
jgi:formate dehydrogenase iron-sulfur subunit